jgi:hypothetical protein
MVVSERERNDTAAFSSKALNIVLSHNFPPRKQERANKVRSPVIMGAYYIPSGMGRWGLVSKLKG